MSKLADQDKFFDLSDYGRAFGTFFAIKLKNTKFTPIHVTLLFGLCGLIGVFCILTQHYYWAGIFIILKSIIDAADGELARIRKTPSYAGRYLDSVFDLIINFLLLSAICYVSKMSFWMMLLAFIGIQLQGTLYNYYYVILRNKSIGGDSTSKIFENKSPKAFPGETQKSVDILFTIYTIVYGVFDAIIHALDPNAFRVKTFPNWFMTMTSVFGLGFQLLIIAVMLSLNWIEFIAPFFIFLTFYIFVLIGIRKLIFKT